MSKRNRPRHHDGWTMRTVEAIRRIAKRAEAETPPETLGQIEKIYWSAFLTYRHMVKSGCDSQLANYITKRTAQGAISGCLTPESVKALLATEAELEALQQSHSEEFANWVLLDENGDPPTLEEILDLGR